MCVFPRRSRSLSSTYAQSGGSRWSSLLIFLYSPGARANAFREPSSVVSSPWWRCRKSATTGCGPVDGFSPIAGGVGGCCGSVVGGVAFLGCAGCALDIARNGCMLGKLCRGLGPQLVASAHVDLLDLASVWGLG